MCMSVLCEGRHMYKGVIMHVCGYMIMCQRELGVFLYDFLHCFFEAGYLPEPGQPASPRGPPVSYSLTHL